MVNVVDISYRNDALTYTKISNNKIEIVCEEEN
jgi:hypothetical protein